MPKKIAIHISFGMMSNFYQLDENNNLNACSNKFEFIFKPFISDNIIMSADVCRSDNSPYLSKDFADLKSFEFRLELALDMPQSYETWLSHKQTKIDELIVLMLPSETLLYNLSIGSNASFNTHPFVVKTLDAETILKLTGLTKRLITTQTAYSSFLRSVSADINLSLQHANPEDFASPASSVSNCAIELFTSEKRVDHMADISNAQGFKLANNVAASVTLTSIDSKSR